MTLRYLPDVEAELSRWFRQQPELTAEISDRVYTVLPSEAQFPLLMLRRVAGGPEAWPPGSLDRPTIQIDAYGGTKAKARQIIDVARALVSERLVGANLNDAMVVVGLAFSNLNYIPDVSFNPAKPRYTLDAILAVRPT